MIRPIDIAGAAAGVAVLAAAPLVFPSSYVVGVLTVCLCYGIWAASWDFMSELTGRENFGHSLFIGTAAYTAGFRVRLQCLVEPPCRAGGRHAVRARGGLSDVAPARALLRARHA